MPTISRRLASAGIADPGDLKSPSLPGASPGSPTGVWFAGNSRPVRLKPEQPWECKSPHADQFGMSTGRASRTCLLNSGLPEKGVWCESTAFRHSCARSSKRAGGLIPRIALDQCRVPERYRTRVPLMSLLLRLYSSTTEQARSKRQVAGEIAIREANVSLRASDSQDLGSQSGWEHHFCGCLRQSTRDAAWGRGEAA